MMNVFLDANIILDAYQNRNCADDCKRILKAIDDGKIKGFLSASSFCTITYYLEIMLKKLGKQKEE